MKTANPVFTPLMKHKHYDVDSSTLIQYVPLKEEKEPVLLPKIESNIPIPPKEKQERKRYKLSRRKFMSELKIGDSFRAKKTLLKKWKNAAYNSKTRIVVRNIAAGEIRIWRAA